MKAFSFRLAQALRWRETELDLQKARAGAAASKLAEVESAVRAKRFEVARESPLANAGATGFQVNSWAEFRRRANDEIRNLETQLLAARKNVDLETGRVVEANRKLRVLESLRSAAQTQWRREFAHELDALADEAFLIRVNSRTRDRAVAVPSRALPARATKRVAAALPAASAEAP